MLAKQHSSGMKLQVWVPFGHVARKIDALCINLCCFTFHVARNYMDSALNVFELDCIDCRL